MTEHYSRDHEEKINNMLNETEIESKHNSTNQIDEPNKAIKEPVDLSTFEKIEQTIAPIIGHHKWAQVVRKAKIFHECIATHTYKTLSGGQLNDPIFGINISWKKGETISFRAVVILQLYVNFEMIQSALKQQELFEFRRQISIILHKFGSETFGNNDKKDNMKLYVAISPEMLRTKSAFRCPLSTTSSLIIAKIFASKIKNGMVYTITPRFPASQYCRAFNASLISDFPIEQEWIICGLMHSSQLQGNFHCKLLSYNNGSI